MQIVYVFLKEMFGKATYLKMREKDTESEAINFKIYINLGLQDGANVNAFRLFYWRWHPLKLQE